MRPSVWWDTPHSDSSRAFLPLENWQPQKLFQFLCPSSDSSRLHIPLFLSTNNSHQSKFILEQDLLLWATCKITRVRDRKGKVLVFEPEGKHKPNSELYNCHKGVCPFSSPTALILSHPDFQLAELMFPSLFFYAARG